MMDFDLEKARNDLEAIKQNMKSYLVSSYCQEPENVEKTFAYLEKSICSVSKRQSLKIQFQPGGDLGWFSELFILLGKWMEAEDNLNDLLNKQLDNL